MTAYGIPISKWLACIAAIALVVAATLLAVHSLNARRTVHCTAAGDCSGNVIDSPRVLRRLP